MLRRTSMVAALLAATAMAAPAVAAPKLGLPKSGFKIHSVDGKGGGWVVHHLLGRGDTLWGCADVSNVQTCEQVFFNAWRPAATMEFLHISKATQDGWLKMSVPGQGDLLFACGTPEGEPACAPVELELRMNPMPSLSRVWPPYQCNYGCGADGALLAKDDPRYVIEDASQGVIWVELGLKAPGPSNLYACRGLGREPVCQLSVPNWLVLDRQDIGIDKIVDIENESPDGTVTYGPGVVVDKVDEESVAYAAGLREGMVIVKVGDFEVNDDKHARAMLAQYPAEHPFTVTLDNGQAFELTAIRKPGKKKK